MQTYSKNQKLKHARESEGGYNLPVRFTYPPVETIKTRLENLDKRFDKAIEAMQMEINFQNGYQ